VVIPAPTTADRQRRRQTPIAGAERPVAEAVDDEVKVGVQVRQHGRVQVHGQRQAVGAVVQQDDDVRAPAAEERDEDDEDPSHLADGLDRCHVTSLSCHLYTGKAKTPIDRR